MKKIFLTFAMMGCMFVANEAVAGSNSCGASNESCAKECAAPCEHATGDCYCKHVKYVPYQYCTTKTVCEPVHWTKRCCRKVPQTYQVRCCRYVPQYYNVQKCRQVNQYYNVDECGTRKKCITCPHTAYRPCYYWVHECKDSCKDDSCTTNGNGHTSNGNGNGHNSH